MKQKYLQLLNKHKQKFINFYTLVYSFDGPI